LTGLFSGSEPVISVLGASGFIGSAIADSADALAGSSVRRLRRSNAPSGAPPVDVRDTSTLRAALAGSDVVVHSASYIGEDPRLCEEVNVTGTGNVVEVWKAERAHRLIYLSTAAVYGRGPFDMAVEGALPLRPASALSASRAAAERLVLDAGGIVVRPHLVLGVGDRWVGPGIAALARALGGVVDDGRARHSVIEASTLGAVVAQLALAGDVDGQVFHAAHLAPVTASELLRLLQRSVPDLPWAAVDPETARERVTSSERLNRALRLLATDHTFDSSRVARLVSVDLEAPFGLSSEAEMWYRNSLAT
jgi:nucleoside-diphosphate-sugar epimerase